MSARALPLAAPRGGGLRVANRAASVALALVLALLALGLGLRAAGTTPLVERSGSMAPTIETGDVVLVRAVPAAELTRGAVVSLQDPVGGRVITHRVAAIERAGAGAGRIALVTRGDANASSERWVLEAGAQVDRMVARVPAVGAPLLWLASPLPRVLLAVLGAGLLIAALARRRG